MRIDPGAVRAFLEAHHLELVAEASEIVERRIEGLAPAEDDAAARSQGREIVRILGETGLLAGLAPNAEPLDLRRLCLLRERVAAASPLADAMLALQALGSMPIRLGGSPEIVDRWLPAVVRGAAVAAFAMTEPEAGSDVSRIATKAVRDGDRYRLEGRKTLISNAGIADFYCVFASTEPAAGRRGISCFLVEAVRPGLRFVAAQRLSEPHPLGELAFEGCEVPSANRLGEEGEGFALGMRVLDTLRPTVAAAACGMAARALAEASDHVVRREQFGRPLASFQLVQAKVAAAATELDAARLLVYRAAWEHDRGAGPITLSAAMAKAFATEAAQRVVDASQQLLGGRGVLAESVVDRLYRAVRALRIYEGTTEIQQLIIARQLLPRSPRSGKTS